MQVIYLTAIIATIIFIYIKYAAARRIEKRSSRLKEKEEALLELLRKKKNNDVN